MKLSKSTVDILKNFSQIGSSMLIRPGNRQTVLHNAGAMYAEAYLKDDFPIEFGIDGLSTFINNIGFFADPDIEFQTDRVVIGNPSMNIVFRSASKKVLTLGPENIDEILTLKKVDAEFVITFDSLKKIIKMSNMNGLPHISIIGKDGKIFMKGFDAESDQSNEGNVALGEYTGNDFKVVFVAENLAKLIEQDYNVKVDQDKYAKFTNMDGSLIYTVSLKTE